MHTLKVVLIGIVAAGFIVAVVLALRWQGAEQAEAQRHRDSALAEAFGAMAELHCDEMAMAKTDSARAESYAEAFRYQWYADSLKQVMADREGWSILPTTGPVQPTLASSPCW